MNRQSIPIHEILVEDRQRKDLGDIDRLAESIKSLGLIQPIVINQDKRLIAGGRRLAAIQRLGWENIDVVYRETLSADELYELELEENVRRQDMSWQERCLCVAKIHKLKKEKAIVNSERWGQRETGELLGLSAANVNYVLTIATLLADKDHAAWKCSSMNEAWKDCVMKQEVEEAEAELARRQAELTQSHFSNEPIGRVDYELTEALPDIPQIEAEPSLVELQLKEAKERYLSNPLNPPDGFEQYWAEKQQRDSRTKSLVYLSTRFFNVDCIEFMQRTENLAAFDHIITDPPYAIDMGMLNQQNPHGGMSDIEDVEDAHQVEPNKALLEKFFPAAWQCTKDKAYVVLWCDIMLWQYLYDLATKQGFAVQRWPITWRKTHKCMNQNAMYNFTKDTEIAMVCRKPGSALMSQCDTSVISASSDEMKRLLGHPFAKPFECWQFLVEHISTEGQLILDPFVGRGSSALSMLKLNRKVVGCELETHHYNSLMENLRRYYLAINPEYVFV